MNNIIANISDIGRLILSLQGIVFCLILVLGLYQANKTRPLRKRLHQSLSNSIDTIDPQFREFRIAIECRSRYRRAAERIENVDTEAIVYSEVAKYPVIQIGHIRWTFLQIDELLQGGPSYLVTLGLIGTFTGLIQNMSSLSGLLLTGEGVSSQSGLIEGFASIFPSMGAAFSTSLLGVFLSSCLWITGILFGISRTKTELEQLLCGYLEQVVQADCRCYSLVGESMERMEEYLTDYLSKFSYHVGTKIEASIENAIGRLVSTLSNQVAQTTAFIEKVSTGSEKIARSGEVFYQATLKLEKSSFAKDFSEACSLFIEHTQMINQASSLMNDSVSTLDDTTKNLVISIDQSKEIQSDLANNFLNAIYVIESSGNTLQRSNSESNEALKEAVTAMQSLQKRGMTWLSMRAKTDTKLTELNEQLQSTLTQYAIIADRIATSADTSFSSYTEQIGELSRASQSLQEKVIQQELGLKEVKDGLSRIASIEQKLEISGGNEETK